MFSSREINKIKRVHAMIKTVFPEAKLRIETPDRSEMYQAVIQQFKDAGLSGIWRVRK